MFLVSYLKPGDGEPALPEQDCDIDWWWIGIDDDCGRSKSESVRGLCGGALVLKRSSSLSPIISGDDSRLCSVCIWMETKEDKFRENPNFNFVDTGHMKNPIMQIHFLTRSVKIGVLSPLSRFRCSSLSRSALRHFARRFWNQTCKEYAIFHLISETKKNWYIEAVIAFNNKIQFFADKLEDYTAAGPIVKLSKRA